MPSICQREIRFLVSRGSHANANENDAKTAVPTPA
jgi:hypothetical protein